MRYRVTGYDRSGSNLFSRVVEAIGPDHAKIVALVELRKSFADAHLADKAERLEAHLGHSMVWNATPPFSLTP